MRSLIAALMIVIAPGVMADQYRPEVRIKAPTALVSGAPLALKDITKYSLYCGGKKLADIVPTAAETKWLPEWGIFAPGTHSCHATATAFGEESAASNAVQYIVTPAAPAPPIIIVVVGG